MAAVALLPPNALRVAAVWGTTVVALRTLVRGESFVLGDDERAALPIPDGLEMSSTPLRAAAAGWELDPRGSIGGLLTLRGRPEDPAAVARTGAAVPVMPGDFGLIQYGQLAIFFQYTSQPKKVGTLRGPELLGVLALFCSAILHIGVLVLVRALHTPPQLALPLALTDADELASRFGMKRAMLEPPAPATAAGDEPGGDPAPKDPRPEQPKADKSGGPKIQGDEGKFGAKSTGDRTTIPGEVTKTTSYGGLSEVLEGDTGKEIQNTLKSINTVSAALSGLSAKDMVLGAGSGTGLKGGGSGGGGTGAGVAFGAGTLDTGFGAGGAGGRGAGGAGGGRGGGRPRGGVAATRRSHGRADPARGPLAHERGPRLLRDRGAAQSGPEGRRHGAVVDRAERRRDERVGRLDHLVESARRRVHRSSGEDVEVPVCGYGHQREPAVPPRGRKLSQLSRKAARLVVFCNVLARPDDLWSSNHPRRGNPRRQVA